MCGCTDDGAEPGYSSIEVRKSKGRSLPRMAHSVLGQGPSDDVYSVVDPKRNRDKTASVHVNRLVLANGNHGNASHHGDGDVYARVSKPAKRQQSARAGSDGAAAAIRGW